MTFFMNSEIELFDFKMVVDKGSYHSL